MLPAGIISSGGELVIVSAPDCDAAGAVVEPETGGAVASNGAAVLGAAVVAGLLVALTDRIRIGGRRVGVFPAVGVCAQPSRAVKNKIRASVVVFILPL